MMIKELEKAGIRDWDKVKPSAVWDAIDLSLYKLGGGKKTKITLPMRHALTGRKVSAECCYDYADHSLPGWPLRRRDYGDSWPLPVHGAPEEWSRACSCDRSEPRRNRERAAVGSSVGLIH